MLLKLDQNIKNYGAIQDINKLYFISDLHFNHANIINFDGRPFESVEEMNATLLENIYNTMPEDGILVHLGDFTCIIKDLKKFVKPIKRKIIHIRGNHDNIDLTDFDNVIMSVDNLTIKFNDDELGDIKLFLSHYPHLSWDGCFYNYNEDGTQRISSFHLYGHTHKNFIKDEDNLLIQEYLKRTLTLNVGAMCDEINYKPISYTQLKIMMKNRLNEINGEYKK